MFIELIKDVLGQIQVGRARAVGANWLILILLQFPAIPNNFQLFPTNAN
jgi:hypothetical protein